MGRQRDTETRLRDAKAVELRRRGLSYAEIANQLGLRSPSSAFDAVKRGLRDFYKEELADAEQIELDRLDDALRTLYRVMMTRHFKVSNAGSVVMFNGEPVLDNAVNVQAALGIKALSESRRKLLGLDAPSRSRVEVITEDSVDQAIRELETKHEQMALEAARVLAEGPDSRAA